MMKVKLLEGKGVYSFMGEYDFNTELEVTSLHEYGVEISIDELVRGGASQVSLQDTWPFVEGSYEVIK